MHKVEVAAVGPFVLAVIDDESQVGWHPIRLDWREVGANDLGAGELIGHYYTGPSQSRPDSFVFPISFRLPSWHLRRNSLSMAQIPVPVPRSMIFCGFVDSGA